MEEESSKRNLKAKSGSQFLNILRQRQQQRTGKTVSPVLKLFNNISFFGLKRKPRSLKLVFNKSNITHRYVCINFFNMEKSYEKFRSLASLLKIRRLGTNGPVIKNLLANAGGVGSIPGIDLRRSYVPQSH